MCRFNTLNSQDRACGISNRLVACDTSFISYAIHMSRYSTSDSLGVFNTLNSQDRACSVSSPLVACDTCFISYAIYLSRFSISDSFGVFRSN